jgi:hypothetical protein
MLKLTVLLVCVALIGQTLCQGGIPKAQVDARVSFFKTNNRFNYILL